MLENISCLFIREIHDVAMASIAREACLLVETTFVRKRSVRDVPENRRITGNLEVISLDVLTNTWVVT